MKVPFLLFIIALIIRLAAVLFWQFDGLYGQDAFAYYQQALDIIQNVPAGKPPPTDFFWPNGYPLLITGFMLVVGSKPLAGQLAALSAGAALAPLVYWLARDLWESDVNIEPTDNQLTTRNDQVGFLAGLIVAVAGQPILSSVVIMADIPALFWATLAAWSVVRGLRSALFEAKAESNPHALESDPAISQQTVLAGLNLAAGAWFTAAGAALGLAIITRWIYILVVPALGFYTLFKIVSHRRSGWLPTPAILSGLVVLLPQLWLSLNKPESLLHNWLLGWQPVNFFQRRFETADGLASYRLPMAVFYAQPAGHPAYIFPILGLAALWSIWRLWQTKSWGALILLLGWAGPVYLFLAGIPFQNFRFGLSLYVPLVVLTGFGVSELLGRAGGAQRSRGAGAQRSGGAGAQGSGGAEGQGRRGAEVPRQKGRSAEVRRSGFTLSLLKGIIVLSLVGMLGWAYPMVGNFLTAHNQSKELVRQVKQRLPPQATLLTFGLTLTFQYYTDLNTLELFYFDRSSLETLIQTRTPFYLLLDVDNVETQWQDRVPQSNYHWLRDHTHLTEIDDYPPYVLFKITAQ